MAVCKSNSLISLSQTRQSMQTSSERATAENVRMVLRAGFQKMLSNMQKLRENDPAAAAATAVELRKLAKVAS